MADVVRDTRTHQVLAAASRMALLAALDRAGRPVPVGEAAESVGLHPNTARAHLERLVDVGLAERSTERRSTPGRPRTFYAAVPGALGNASADDQASYQQLAALLAGELAMVADPRVAAVEAGRRWAKAMAARTWPSAPDVATTVAALVDLLTELGFDPADRGAPESIDLRRCPFAEVARDNRAVVCGIHLGLLQETAERSGGPVRIAGLDPFVEEAPLRCVVRLRLVEGTLS